MGPEAARERAATPAETAEIAALVSEGLRLGALGFSTDQVVGNIGPGNTALPGQVCADDELLAVARALGAGPGPGLFTMAPRALLLDRAERRADLEWHEQLAAASGRPVVIGPVFDTYDEPGVGLDLLDAMGDAQARGNRVVGQVSPRPFELWTRLDAPGVLVRVLPTLSAAVKNGGAEGVRRLANDPDAMARLREEGARIQPSLDVQRPVGSRARALLAPQRRPPRPRPRDDRRRARRGPGRRADRHRDRRRLRDAVRDRDAQPRRRRASASSSRIPPRSSAGATPARTPRATPTAATQSGRCSTGCARRGVLSLETAVAMLTARQADLFGIRDRGRITPGAFADLVLFDPGRVGIDDVRYVSDMPAGGTRLVAEPVGIAASIVNGTIVTRDGAVTGARPGSLLRGA